jgi:hypothetical protein
MSDDIKETTDICKAVSAGYMVLLAKKISYAKIIKCLEQSSFGSLSDDELLSVKDVSEFLARAFIAVSDSLNSLTKKDNEWAHGLTVAIVICLELKKRDLIKDELGQLKDIVLKER